MPLTYDSTVSMLNSTVQLLVQENYFPSELASRKFLPTDRLDDLGIDSLGAIAFIAELEKQADVHLNAEALESVETFGDLAKLLMSSAK